jgi:hypothetical protein
MRGGLLRCSAATVAALCVAGAASAAQDGNPVATGIALKGHWYHGSAIPEHGSDAGSALQFKVSPDGKTLIHFVFNASYTCAQTASSDFFSVPDIKLHTQVKPYKSGLKQTYNDFSFKGPWKDTAPAEYHGGSGTISITGAFSNGGRSIKGKVLVNFTITDPDDSGCSTGTLDWSARPGSGPVFR